MQPLQRTLGFTSPIKSRAVTATVLAIALGSLAACGGDDKSDIAENKISVEEYPDYYPDDYADRDGTLLAYESPELGELPDFAQLLPNVYAMSTDPMTIAYNTELVTEAPTGVCPESR